MKVRHVVSLAALALLLAAGGCARSPYVKVKGKVTWKGQPVPSTLVTFLPEDGSRSAKGLTDDKGAFVLRYSRTQLGATRRRCTVVLQYVPSNEEELGKVPPQASRELKAVIERYREPNT